MRIALTLLALVSVIACYLHFVDGEETNEDGQVGQRGNLVERLRRAASVRSGSGEPSMRFKRAMPILASNRRGRRPRRRGGRRGRRPGRRGGRRGRRGGRRGRRPGRRGGRRGRRGRRPGRRGDRRGRRPRRRGGRGGRRPGRRGGRRGRRPGRRGNVTRGQVTPP
ncbi:ribose import ATP-binding protein RbsA 1-like isoform X2 [Haliotis rufescens]|uniref:ribose import ATP-binding protein RbsA 1-like isoform X2 n=1 Tax=Haliotis rufescens TaxID=6454 RepID=UPI00201E85EA|nr:ribose import ATP-binding protein RbsA 1-like isoform X2 [Haliotis rufescens]